MARIASPTFVGRVAELAALDEALADVAKGRASTVLVGGDAGVGKSRLLETWSARARDFGATVATGSCLDLGESGPAYVSIVQAFRDLLRPLTPAAIDELVGSDRSIVALVIPELEVEAGPIEGIRVLPIAQTRLFDRLVRLLDRAASDRPVVLVLEDIHWADPSTRAFLLYCVENSESSKLMIVATYRTEETSRDHPLASVLRQLAHHPRAMRLDLLPFDMGELREQLSGILGAAPADRLLSAIHARSEGNALFAEELVATGDPATDLPSSIGAALLSRTAGRSRAAQAVLRVTAVSGRTVSYDVLSMATGLSEDDLSDALRDVVDVNILEPEHAGETYRFRHALLQEAIYGDILPGERRRIHAGVAEALVAGADGQSVEAGLAAQLAHHWSQARDYERAFRASLDAADTAARQTAYAESLNHYLSALALWDRAPLANADVDIGDLLDRGSRVAFLAGEPQEAVVLARRALDRLGATDRGSHRVHVLDLISRALQSMSQEEEAHEYERELSQIQPDDLPAVDQAMILDARVRIRRWSGDRAGARTAALEAIRVADQIGDADVKGDAQAMMGWVLLEAGEYEQAIDAGVRAREFASTAEDAETELEALSLIYESYLTAGDFGKSIDAARSARAFAERSGMSRSGGPWASFAEAKALFELGRISESSEAIEAAVVDAPENRSYLILHLLAAEIGIVQGALDEAARHIEASRIPGPTIDEEGRGYLATVRSKLALAEGRLDDVRMIVTTSAPRVANLESFTDMSETIWALVEVGLDAEAARAESARAAGDTEQVGACLAAAETLKDHVERVRRTRDRAGLRDSGTHDGDEALIAGHLARIRGADDPELWAAAAGAFASRSPRGLQARYRQAEAMLHARRPRDDVRAVMRDGHLGAAEIGAQPLTARFEALAKRARIDIRPATSTAQDEEAMPAAEPALGPGVAALRKRGLSDREIEVLTLVAAGFSNREIGLRLFISTSTASVHVSHILNKLDAATRTEAATIGARLGLPDVELDTVTG